ncbi:MAG: PEP-CTERM sorting domain-containing protein [Alteromonadaceae bacterium]
MKFSKFIVAVAFSVLSINTFATNITGEVIMDNYIGAGYNGDVNGDDNKWDIDKMLVSRDVSGGVTTLEVNIFTSFYDNVGTYGIKLGDLFMAADQNLNNSGKTPWNPEGTDPYTGDRYTNSNAASTTDTNWNYVYDLSGARKHTSGTGHLKSGFGSNQVVTSSSLHNRSRANQAVMLSDRNTDIVHDSSIWNVLGYSYTSNNINYGQIKFSFDVSGTDLATANQIAFRWAMTCANDIIEGLADFSSQNPPVDVPEPNTIILMLLAMAGLIYRKKVNN